MSEAPRIDKWLWAIRIYKTRSMATEACRSGKVKIDDQEVKPSREVKLGDEVVVNLGPVKRTLKVTGMIERRVSASLAVENYEDLTPEEEYERAKIARETNFEKREKGVGRPTKKERRIIERLKKYKHF